MHALLAEAGSLHRADVRIIHRGGEVRVAAGEEVGKVTNPDRTSTGVAAYMRPGKKHRWQLALLRPP